MVSLEPQRVYGFYRDGLLDQVMYFPGDLAAQSLPDPVVCGQRCSTIARGRTVVELDPAKLPELGSTLVA